MSNTFLSQTVAYQPCYLPKWDLPRVFWAINRKDGPKVENKSEAEEFKLLYAEFRLTRAKNMRRQNQLLQKNHPRIWKKKSPQNAIPFISRWHCNCLQVPLNFFFNQLFCISLKMNTPSGQANLTREARGKLTESFWVRDRLKKFFSQLAAWGHLQYSVRQLKNVFSAVTQCVCSISTAVEAEEKVEFL